MDYAEVAWSTNIWKYDKLRQRMRILSNNFTRGNYAKGNAKNKPNDFDDAVVYASILLCNGD